MTLLQKLARIVGLEAPLTHIDIGKTAPSFSLKSLEGKEYSLKELLKQGPVVAAFFKISCPVCQYTFPFLQRLYKRFGSNGVSFVAISQDDARSTKEFNQEYGVTFPTLVDAHGYPASNAYGLTSVPTIFLIEPDGRVRVSSLGFSKADLEKIASELAQRERLPATPLFRSDEIVPDYKPG